MTPLLIAPTIRPEASFLRNGISERLSRKRDAANNRSAVTPLFGFRPGQANDRDRDGSCSRAIQRESNKNRQHFEVMLMSSSSDWAYEKITFSFSGTRRSRHHGPRRL